jgi:hypothetical protein
VDRRIPDVLSRTSAKWTFGLYSWVPKRDSLPSGVPSQESVARFPQSIGLPHSLSKTRGLGGKNREIDLFPLPKSAQCPFFTRPASTATLSPGNSGGPAGGKQSTQDTVSSRAHICGITAFLVHNHTHTLGMNSKIRATLENLKHPAREIFFIPYVTRFYANFDPSLCTEFSQRSCNFAQ